MKGYRVAAGSAVLLSIVLLILPRLIPICTGRIKAHGELLPMACHYAFQAEFIIGLLALIAAASLFVLKTGEGRLFAAFMVFLLGLTILIIPQSWAIGICPAGGCLKTAFFSSLAGALLSVSGAVALWLAYRAEQEAGG